MLAGPSNAPSSRQRAFRPPPNSSTYAGALAPVYDGASGQHAYAAAPASALPSQYPNEVSTSLDLLNNIHQAPASREVGLVIQENNSFALGQAAGPGFTAPFAGYIQDDSTHLCICNGDHWFAWCDLAWEHYNVAMNSPIPVIRLSCSCPRGLPAGQIPKGCPLVADHLLGWVSHHHPIYAKEVGLHRFINSCMHLTICKPTS